MVSIWRDANVTAPKRAVVSLGLILCLGCAATMVQVGESFQTTTTSTLTQLPSSSMSRNTRQMPIHRQGVSDPLYMFGRNKEEEGDGEAEKKKSKLPFFGRLSRSKGGDNNGEEPPEPEPQLQEEKSQPPTVVASATELRPPKPKKKDPPNADDLRLMAEKARLEAERLDAELTLAKIEKLEQQLLKSKKDEGADNASVVEDLQYQLDVLQAKLKGEPMPVKKTVAKATTTTTTSKPAASTDATTTTTTTTPSTNEPIVRVATEKIEVEVPRSSAIVEIDDAKVLEIAALIATNEPKVFTEFKDAEELTFFPEFVIKIIAPFYGLKPGDDGKIDRDEFMKRGKMAMELDYSFLDRDPPSFDKSDIREKKAEIMQVDTNNIRSVDADSDRITMALDESTVTITNKMIEKADGNATQLALYSLEYDYYMYGNLEEMIEENLSESIASFFENTTYFGSMYPKCVTARGENKGDDYVSEEPTEAQIEVLTKTILPAVKFSSSSKPEKVPGGYAITGSHKFEDGDALIEAIDNEIAKSRPNLKDQLTVLYTPSYGPINNALSSEDMNELSNMDMNTLMNSEALELFAESEPILYITGPTIVRDSNPLGLGFASILGLATSWYLSVYPFLLNEKIASRIDSDLQLVDSGLQPDLSYLTDLSVPLFVCFMGIQLVHEAAHRLTAISKGVKLSVPVFVPSLITGVTSTVTTFKTLPKNKNDMFDISASGPLAGVVVSSIALTLGAKLTLISDPATLPALPLDILRQSTLGGAIIDNVITGSLYVPDGAPTAGIQIPLHPIAIAGYVGLIVNALALLPVGTTDGGRLTMALFDRAEKMSIGSLTLAALLFAGLFGSDLFLFYFSFCLAFQTGNEVPARNEQDSVDFSRIFVALVCYGLAILTLVPFQ